MRINFGTLFSLIATKHDDRTAVINVERERRYSYAEFHRLTNQVARMMRQRLGLAKNDRFMVITNNDNSTLLHFQTILKGDATAVFANIRDSLDVHKWQIEHTSPKVVFLERDLILSHSAYLLERGIVVVSMDPPDDPIDGIHIFWDLLDGISDEDTDIELHDREHVALIRYTGGTSGDGKPAEYSPDNLVNVRDNFLALEEADWTATTRILHMSPLSHGGGLFFITGLFCGASNVTLNDPDLCKFCRVVERERVTTTFVVPTLLYRLLDFPDALTANLTSLQNIYYGAAPMSATKLKLLQERFGNVFTQLYASTESFCASLQMSKAAHAFAINENETLLAAAGRPVTGVELMLMGEDGAPVSQGEVGEMWLRSRGTISGYYRNDVQTAAEFENGFWKSGDMAWMDEKGFVFLVDRKKDLVISGGFNIYPSEVEMAINAHPAVLMSAVVGVPHEEWGEALHAEVIIRENENITESELIGFVKNELGSYKAPKTVRFVSQLPLSPAGKVLRRAVRDQHWKNTSLKIN